MYARILLFVLVLLAPLAHGAVGVTPGGGGSGGGPTNGITAAQATNIVAAIVTNKVDKVSGFATNLWGTNVAFHGAVAGTNVDFTWHMSRTNTNITTFWSLGDNGGFTRSWQHSVFTNRMYWQTRESANKQSLTLWRDGTGNITLGADTSSTTTNAGNLRVLGTAYDANGNPYSTNSAGGSQTPWTSDINGAGYSLTNVGNVWGGGQLFMDYVSLTPDSNEVGVAISPLTGAGNLVRVLNTNGNEALLVTPDGKVGIGTNAPAATLHIDTPYSSGLWIRRSNAEVARIWSVPAGPNTVNSLVLGAYGGGNGVEIAQNTSNPGQMILRRADAQTIAYLTYDAANWPQWRFVVGDDTKTGLGRLEVTGTVNGAAITNALVVYTNGLVVTRDLNTAVGTNIPAARLHIHGSGSNNIVAISGVTNATPATPGTVAAWIPITLNGTNGFIPFYQ